MLSLVDRNRVPLKAFNPIFTSTVGSFSIIRSVAIPYQLLDGSWRMNIEGIVGTGSTTSFDMTILGVSMVSSMPISCYQNASSVPAICYASTSSKLQFSTASASTGWYFSGDIALTSKPSFVE